MAIHGETKNGSRASNRGIGSRDEGVAVLVNHPISILFSIVGFKEIPSW
jgi:hypothetical protein